MSDLSSKASCDIKYGDHESQFVRVHSAQCIGSTGSRESRDIPIVFLIHGGFWKEEYGLNTAKGTACESLAYHLVARGFCVVEVEYRRGSAWGYPHTNNDVLCAIQFSLQKWGSRTARQNFCIVGMSAGGQLALWATLELPTDRKPALTVAIAPVADLERAHDLKLSNRGDAVLNYMHGTPRERPKDYQRACPMCRAQEFALLPTSLLLVTALKDIDVPSHIVIALHRRLQSFSAHAEKSVLLNFADHDHYDLMSAGTVAWRKITEFIEGSLLSQHSA